MTHHLYEILKNYTQSIVDSFSFTGFLKSPLIRVNILFILLMTC